MRDFFEGILVMIGFILIVLGVNLAWKWHEYNEMDRELEMWKRDLVEERNTEARGL